MSSSPTLAAARLHLLTVRSALVWPWAILASSFAINLLVQALLSPQDRATMHTGGLASIYVVVAIFAAQSVAGVFPFALGVGVTRRAFAAGTAIFLAGEALAFGIVLTGLRMVEQGTSGFGLGLRFFRMFALSQDNPLLQLPVYVALFLVLDAAMALAAVMHLRFGQSGVFLLCLTTVLVVGLLVVLVTWLGAWHRLYHATVGLPAPVTLLLWPVLVTLAAAAVAYPLLRRASP